MNPGSCWRMPRVLRISGCHPGFRSCRRLPQQLGHPNQVPGHQSGPAQTVFMRNCILTPGRRLSRCTRPEPPGLLQQFRTMSRRGPNLPASSKRFGGWHNRGVARVGTVALGGSPSLGKLFKANAASIRVPSTVCPTSRPCRSASSTSRTKLGPLRASARSRFLKVVSELGSISIPETTGRGGCSPTAARSLRTEYRAISNDDFSSRSGGIDGPQAYIRSRSGDSEPWSASILMSGMIRWHSRGQ